MSDFHTIESFYEVEVSSLNDNDIVVVTSYGSEIRSKGPSVGVYCVDISLAPIISLRGQSILHEHEHKDMKYDQRVIETFLSFNDRLCNIQMGNTMELFCSDYLTLGYSEVCQEILKAINTGKPFANQWIMPRCSEEERRTIISAGLIHPNLTFVRLRDYNCNPQLKFLYHTDIYYLLRADGRIQQFSADAFEVKDIMTYIQESNPADYAMVQDFEKVLNYTTQELLADKDSIPLLQEFFLCENINELIEPLLVVPSKGLEFFIEVNVSPGMYYPELVKYKSGKLQENSIMEFQALSTEERHAISIGQFCRKGYKGLNPRTGEYSPISDDWDIQVFQDGIYVEKGHNESHTWYILVDGVYVKPNETFHPEDKDILDNLYAERNLMKQLMD